MVHLQEFHEEYNDKGLVMLGFNCIDGRPIAPDGMRQFGVTYPSGPDLQSEAARKYGIKGVPETFFIDPDGQITEIVIGPITSQQLMDSYLQEIRP